MKKLLTLFMITLAVFMVFTACGNSANEAPSVAVDESKDYSKEKLVIWSFTDELDTAGDIAHFEEMYTASGKPFEGIEVEFVAVSIQDGYMDKILPALESGNGPDIFTGELDHIKQFIEAGYYADIETMMANDPEVDLAGEKADYKEYIWQSGIDPATGKLAALSWQVTPGAIFFKTDMAAAVWGDEAGFPQEGSEDYNTAVTNWMNENKFNTVENLLQAQMDVKAYDANWRLFPDDQAVRHFAAGTNDPAMWLDADGKLNPAKVKEQVPYINLVKEMYGDTIDTSLTANAAEWSGPWFDAMDKDLTDAEGNTWQVMAYSMPTWGLKYIIEPNMEKVDAEGNTLAKPAEDADQATKDAYADALYKGNWGMASGPNSYFWGGTYLGINADTELPEVAFSFLKSMVFDKERLVERQIADGDMYSVESVMAPAIAGYEGRQSLGGMNHLQVFNDEAAKINLSSVTTYDRGLNDLLGVHITNYKQGADGYNSVSDVLEAFYADVQVTYPEIYVEGLPTE
ncbi:extracellular solute-binding protein [Acidaminobacter sp. JC074]|uniref:extracellular solute-binding protein n=1 Tax=Acidaminobacter sp. JC074 TaxID=2530199 RepID=UPI001F0E2B4B|nr:extracellular solute-binding protein [Acidaminobacter sp. JC074]MCH4889961.1 extracellular solute-binding protein [Acidaminobacter sp. JC074]